jgi:hypothetical protein
MRAFARVFDASCRAGTGFVTRGQHMSSTLWKSLTSSSINRRTKVRWARRHLDHGSFLSAFEAGSSAHEKRRVPFFKLSKSRGGRRSFAT